ncbi:MAG: response regulator [Polyangiaceae bacterium]|nr:response regulator [Polyangiaceae bacterium]
MTVPVLPSDEVSRSATLGYLPLDAATDAALTGLVSLAADVLGASGAALVLVGPARQHLLSTRGAGNIDHLFVEHPLLVEGCTLRLHCALSELEGSTHELATAFVTQAAHHLESARHQRAVSVERGVAQESARRLEVLFEAMSEGVVVQERSGEISAANTAAARILGLTPEQLAGRSSLDPTWRCVREDGSPFPGSEHLAMVTLQTGVPMVDVVMGVYKDGETLSWISVNALPLRERGADAPYAVITTFHDITAMKAAQEAAERLTRQEHVVTTGTLAAGIGHEINNPLTFLLANLEFSLGELDAVAGGEPTSRVRGLAKALVEAQEGGERIRKIVGGLRALAREVPKAVPTDVGRAVASAVSMATVDLRGKATVVDKVGSSFAVMADESRLAQILVSLLVNAAQAFEGEDATKNRVVVACESCGDGRVCISVSDNGPGIPPELHRRIFDPFFTTKPIGQATGLGLSISRSIVTSLGGVLDVDSSLGGGTTFRIQLPAAEATTAKAPTRATVAPGAAGRILVIDDEPAVLAAIGRILGKDHDVVMLSDSREALRQIEAGEHFDVVFCDLMMPHLSGDALYERVATVAPAIAARFVFITGGACETRLQRFLSQAPNPCLDKPFSIDTLRTAAQQQLERHAAPAPA